MRRRIYVPVVAAVGVLLTGCQSNGFLPNGSYSGSTAQEKAINVVVGDGGITLDGTKMHRRTDGWFEAEHDKHLRLRCHPAFHGDELVCDVNRHGQLETDELMKI